MAKRLPEGMVFVDRDNDGALYICAYPLRWIQDPRSPLPLSTPRTMQREDAERAIRDIAGRKT